MLIVDPSLSGDTYLRLTKLEKTVQKEVFFRRRSPEQHSEGHIEIKITEINEQEGGFVIFEDMLENNKKTFDPFFTTRRHNDLDVYYLSQFFFVY